ncbi:MAG: hypothetical protein EXS64_02030 [Candidatus Latescibacteria bacterium]|nr:hypothetical protein [Candidatus Latescibacterota bacterium]
MGMFGILPFVRAYSYPRLEITSGEDLRDYYGGFYPDEAWVASIGPIPRALRGNPQMRYMVGGSPKATPDDFQEKARPFLKIDAQALIGMVPRRNRLAGNSRVMPVSIPVCPVGDGGLLTWSPDCPDRIRCSKGHPVDPFEIYPPTGAIEIVGPKGDRQRYPYHDAPDGMRVYLQGEYMDALRVCYLTEAARILGLLYQDTGEEAYAERAAAILYGFGCAVPHWPKVHRGRPGVAEEDRFRPVTDHWVYVGLWYDKYHTGIKYVGDLAQGYDLVASAPVWENLDRLSPGGDARATVESDLFLYSARDALRYDVHYPHPESALSNYIPYQVMGLISIGRGAGVPELVHYAYWKLRQMAQKTLMADAVFPESVSYALQHIKGMSNAARLAEGYSDPPGFVSTVDGRRFDALDNARELPQLRRAIETLDTMLYPDGEYMTVHDTYGRLQGESTRPALREVRSLIWPAFGHAVLGGDGCEKGNPTQAHLHYSGNWGHDHHDMLNFILWSCGEELIPDIGYTWTYRMFTTNTSGHNLVVVDRGNQGRVGEPGNLIGWHPAKNDVQVVEVSAPTVYPQCSVYRRAIFLVPTGGREQVVLDIFEVAGGNTHEWMAHGACSSDRTLEVSVPTHFHAESYADDGQPFTPQAHSEWEKELNAQGLQPWRVDPWYGVFRGVHRGQVEGPFTATFRPVDRSLPEVRLHLVAPTDGELYTCTIPSIRRCWQKARRGEDASLVERFRTPKLIFRRDGERLRSRFVALWEPMQGGEGGAEVERLTQDDHDGVGLEVRWVSAGVARSVRVFYAPDLSGRRAFGRTVDLQGRYATILSEGVDRRVTLYDCAYFRDGDLEVTISRRPALPVAEVCCADGKGYSVILDGTWTDIPDGAPLEFPEPELVILTQDSGHSRVFPVDAVERKGDRTLLRCSRHPGFAYDAATGTLRETFVPFHEIDGKAEATLPSRVWLRSHRDRPGVLQVRTTDALLIGSRRVERTPDWTAVSV